MVMTTHLDIISAEEEIFSGRVEYIEANGECGRFGILANHAPFLTKIKMGMAKVIKQHSKEEFFFLSGGFIEIQKGCVTILSDTVKRGEQIDLKEAQDAIDRAKKNIQTKSKDFDYAYLANELAKAVEQLKVAKYSKKKLL